MKKNFIEIQNLNVSFKVNKTVVNILHNINLNIEKEDSVAIIGESGSGKSMLVKTICGILPSNLSQIIGTITFKEKNIELNQGIDKKYIGIVLQNPMQSFNPTIKISDFMNDVFKANNINDDKNNTKKIKIIQDLDIKDPNIILHKYPYELSGGMLQRLAIGIALAQKPEILICDEPTSSLDIITQKKIINLIQKQKEEHNFTLIFITHDISLIEKFCNKVVIIKKGEIIEQGKTEDILKKPQELYAKELIKISNL